MHGNPALGRRDHPQLVLGSWAAYTHPGWPCRGGDDGKMAVCRGWSTRAGGARLRWLQKVRPPFAGDPLGLGAPPLRDFGMVSGIQDLGDGAALEILRPGVMRIFQPA